MVPYSLSLTYFSLVLLTLSLCLSHFPTLTYMHILFLHFQSKQKDWVKVDLRQRPHVAKIVAKTWPSKSRWRGSGTCYLSWQKLLKLTFLWPFGVSFHYIWSSFLAFNTAIYLKFFTQPIWLFNDTFGFTLHVLLLG